MKGEDPERPDEIEVAEQKGATGNVKKADTEPSPADTEPSPADTEPSPADTEPSSAETEQTADDAKRLWRNEPRHVVIGSVSGSRR